jgi:hypothetical protein
VDACTVCFDSIVTVHCAGFAMHVIAAELQPSSANYSLFTNNPLYLHTATGYRYRSNGAQNTTKYSESIAAKNTLLKLL